MDDDAARHLYRSIVGVMFLFIFLRFIAAQLVPLSPSNDAIAASRLITSPIVLVLPIRLIVTMRTAAQQWLGGLGRPARYAAFIGRFARDTDLDKLRQATGKVSDDIMAAPELKQALLEPLKMEGIADVGDNALVIRFKFVTRPGSPGTVQHEAMSRMLTMFPQLGIAFAT